MARTSKAFLWLRLARPLIMFISVFGSLVGTLNVTIAKIPVNEGVTLNWGTVFFVVIGAMALSAGLMIHNDYTDLPSDKINRPLKPLPRGEISVAAAKWAGIALMAVATIAGFATTLPQGRGLNWLCGILTLVVFISGVEYNRRGKKLGIWGHIIVAFGVGAIPWWGAVAHRPQDWDLMVPLALAIFVMEIGREIMVCAGDLKGDLAAGFSTVPVRMGREKSMVFSLYFYLGFVPIFPLAMTGGLGFRPVFGPLYLVGATVFIWVLFATWAKTMWVVLDKKEANIWHAFEKNIRMGTRLAVVFFQVILFLEVFF